MKVLIPGIAGQLGQMVALRCRELGHEVAGIDRRRWPEAPDGIEVHNVDIRKRAAEEGKTSHFGRYQSWLDFMKFNARAHGVYWLNGVSEYHRSIRYKDDDKASFIPVTVIRDLKVRHIRGNWMLVEVVDFERNTPIGWVRWRDHDGNLMVFPNITSDRLPVMTTAL